MSKKRLTDKDCRGGFFRLVERRVSDLRRQRRSKTADNYACALRHFMRFREGADIAPKDLTATLMADFQAYLVGEGLRMNTVSLYNRVLRASYNHALDEGIIHEDRRPFRKVFTGNEKTRKRAADRKVIRRLIETDIPDAGLDFARDMFLFSIYTQGMAFVDIAHLTPEQVGSGCIRYRRRKTNTFLQVRLHPRARAIIEKWRVDAPACPYLFPILYNPGKGKPVKYASALRLHNKRLDRLSERLRLEVPVSSYVSRHTWASMAKWLGVSETVISEAMGHSSVGTTAIYLALLDSRTVSAANDKVIASLTGIRRDTLKNARGG